jgi:hypothetical protein
MGHEERFPRTRLSAGCGFRKDTIVGMRRNGRDAPTTVLRDGSGSLAERHSHRLVSNPVRTNSETLERSVPGVIRTVTAGDLRRGGELGNFTANVITAQATYKF